jgi:ribosomal protein S18 acetylase RimI-like enzyme
MSLFGQYIQEREDKCIIESDIGFATYSFSDAGVYIQDIYVHPEHRKSGEASRLANEIAVIAKEKGLTKMYGSVVPSANNSTDSLKVLLAYGFKLDSSSNNFIVMVKGI